MASKLKWEKVKGFGNTIEEHICICMFRGEKCKIGIVRVFKKGEYCLPIGMFQQTKKLQPQKTKTLSQAKTKVQKWWDEFIESQTYNPIK